MAFPKGAAVVPNTRKANARSGGDPATMMTAPAPKRSESAPMQTVPKTLKVNDFAKPAVKGDLGTGGADNPVRSPMHNVDSHISAAIVKKSHPTGHSRKGR